MTAFLGNDRWIDYALSGGHWYTGPGQAVVPKRLLTTLHARRLMQVRPRVHELNARAQGAIAPPKPRQRIAHMEDEGIRSLFVLVDVAAM